MKKKSRNLGDAIPKNTFPKTSFNLENFYFHYENINFRDFILQIYNSRREHLNEVSTHLPELDYLHTYLKDAAIDNPTSLGQR